MLMGEGASLKWKVGSNDALKEVDFVVLTRMNFRRKPQQYYNHFYGREYSFLCFFVAMMAQYRISIT
jgi:hypothetical protein